MRNKLIYLIFVFIFSVNLIQSQVTFGSNEMPEPFSILQLDNGEGGLRLNQLNEVQKNTLTSELLLSTDREKTKGLSIYDTNTKTIQCWDGNRWIRMIGVESLFSSGSYLKSNGTGSYPDWFAIKLPVVKQGDYYLYSYNVREDAVGCVLSDMLEDYFTYKEFESLSDKWSVIEGLNVDLDIPVIDNVPSGTIKNRVSLLFQTCVQIGTGVIDTKYSIPLSDGSFEEYTHTKVPSVSFAIGFFIGSGNNMEDYQLYLVRVERVDAKGYNMSATTYSIEGTLENLPPGQHTLKVAVRRRSDRNMETLTDEASRLRRSIAIGTKIPDATNMSPFMTKSFLKTKTYVLNN
ncbi:MAG: hypothetical protein E6767_06140 [Dysgonomonas sp.]|nr:hypothetical protein [Dysgonomonas sp.]